MTGAATRLREGLAAWVAVLAIATLAAGAFLPLGVLAFRQAETGLEELLADPVVWRSLRFTLLQAGLSTLFSVILAIPVATALHEFRAFPGRRLILSLFSLPLALPQIVAVLAIVGIYGERGVVVAALQSVGIDFPSVYGLTGILLAHVFFNMPLAVRIVLGGLTGMPAEYDRLSHQLSMGFAARYRLVYWPFMRPAAMSAASLIFMLCVTSFTVVLTLGGGPRATTLEVAIYQALTFDFDVGRVVMLSLLQVGVTVLAFGLLLRAGGEVSAGVTLGDAAAFPTRRTLFGRLCGALIIALGTIFVLSPFAMIVWRGLAADLLRLAGQQSVRDAIATSLTLGFCAAVISVALSFALASGIAVRAARRGFTGAPGNLERLFGQASSLILVVPPVVIAGGWFILIRLVASPYVAAPIMVVVVNAAMAVPFAIRFMLPAVLNSAERYGRLCGSLDLRGWARFRFVTWPTVRGSMLLGFAFSLALSLGDLGVIAIFGSQDVQTLPYLILQRMGSYRTDDAAGLALILCLLTMALIVVADRGGRKIRTNTND